MVSFENVSEKSVPTKSQAKGKQILCPTKLQTSSNGAGGKTNHFHALPIKSPGQQNNKVHKSGLDKWSRNKLFLYFLKYLLFQDFIFLMESAIV